MCNGLAQNSRPVLYKSFETREKQHEEVVDATIFAVSIDTLYSSPTCNALLKKTNGSTYSGLSKLQAFVTTFLEHENKRSEWVYVAGTGSQRIATSFSFHHALVLLVRQESAELNYTVTFYVMM